MKIDPTVKKETLIIAEGTLVLSVLMQGVFLVIGAWDITVLLGNLLSGFFAVLNFFLMGLGVQKSLEKSPEDAKTTVKGSQALRMVMLFAVVAIGFWLPCFNRWAVLIAVFFPRICVTVRSLMLKKGGPNEREEQK